MRILHVIIPTKRMMETFVQMIRRNYPLDEHTFYFLGKCPKSEIDLFNYGNVVELENGKNKLHKILNFYKDLSKYDYIFWHGLVISPKFSFFLYCFRQFLRKSIWVVWGIDLYSFNRNSGSLKDRAINYINKAIRAKMRYIVAIFPTDIEGFNKMFPNNNVEHFFYAPYPMRKKVFFDLENLDKSSVRKNGELWIQIGNNANSFNRHLEILEHLKKFKNENVRIFIPMSYGNDWHNKIPGYIEIIKQRAIEYFGENRVTILTKLMPLDEYSKFLKQMDIVIIATDRQNALGNILKNMYSGGKVYLSEKNKLYKYFLSQGIRVNKFEDIKNESYSSFSKMSDNTLIKNWMIKNHYPENNLLFWDTIFKQLKYPNALHIDDLTVEINLRNKKIMKEIQKHAGPKEKANYVNLKRYEDSEKNRKLKTVPKIVVVGSDKSTLDKLNYMEKENNVRIKWDILGIIEEEMVDLKELASGYNTIGTIEGYKAEENVRYVILSDDIEKRKKYFTLLCAEEIKTFTVRFSNSYIDQGIKFRGTSYIGKFCAIGTNVVLGNLVNVNNGVVIGQDSIIGDYVTIGENSVIGMNCIIGNDVEIGNNCIIANNCIIGNGEKVKNDTIINKDCVR